jgi:hypothetical protein
VNILSLTEEELVPVEDIIHNVRTFSGSTQRNMEIESVKREREKERVA